MLSLVKKEINTFLNSLIGYIVLLVFFVAMAWFLWIMPGESNILDMGYANIDGLFAITPYLYLFLIPSLTMKTFAEEKKAGTLEFLLTKPISDMQIIFSKYIASVVLVIISLLPTLVYYYSVYNLGNTTGNLDTGSIIGSYLGLLFLGSAFIAIGVFASSLTDSQIISFVLSMLLCYLFYVGFDSMSDVSFLKNYDIVFYILSINRHYVSISRGVIDTRDVLYFISVILIFLFATRTVLESRKW
jgi:ABC-2 type transport system permease protein